MSFWEKIKEKKWTLLLILAIISLGIFLRTYNFSKWLHFEIDQSYDFLMVSPAVEQGIENLPLLGPTAGGGRALRLGPAFYYMEYASAKVFGNNPTGHAMLVLIFSILAIPLFYIFSRRYFSQKISIGLLLIFSTSLYLVLYSRFSWSPNVLPFLVMACFYALLRSVSPEEKNRNLWFLISVSFIAITTQIHFNSFFIVPAVALFFLIIKRPRFSLKTWLISLGIFLVAYSPVIVNEIKTGGQNLAFFQEKITGESDGEMEIEEESDEKGIGEISQKIVQNFRYHAYEYFLIISGKDFTNGSRPKGYDMGLTCKTCTDKLPWRTAGLALFVFGTAALVYKLFREKDEEKKNFLIIAGLWLFFSFIYFFAITYGAGLYIYPRFFLIASPLAIIFLGLIFESIEADKNKFILLVFVITIFSLSYLNVQKMRDNFRQLERAPYENEKVEKEDIFPNNYRVTQEQQLMIADYIESEYKKNNYPVYIKTIHEYEPTLWYYLEQRGICYYDKMESESIFKQGNYFLIPYTSKSEKELEKFADLFDVSEKKDFGSLVVYHLNPKQESITKERQSDSNRSVPIQVKQISELMTWKKLFSIERY